MKTVSIICTIILLGSLWLVLPETKRDGFIILLDESYRAEIVTENVAAPDFSAAQPYETVSNNELRRAVEDEENFTPESVFQRGETIYLTDRKRGKLSRFSPSEGLKAIAVFGGKLINLQSLSVEDHGNIYVLVQPDPKSQNHHLVKFTK